MKQQENRAYAFFIAMIIIAIIIAGYFQQTTHSKANTPSTNTVDGVLYHIDSLYYDTTRT